MFGMTSTSRILPRGCKAMQRDWLVCNLVHCREDNLQTVSFAGPGSNTFAFVWYAATYPEVLDFGTLPGVDRIGPRAWGTEGQVLLFLKKNSMPELLFRVQSLSVDSTIDSPELPLSILCLMSGDVDDGTNCVFSLSHAGHRFPAGASLRRA